MTSMLKKNSFLMGVLLCFSGILLLPAVTMADDSFQAKLNAGYLSGVGGDWSDVYSGGGQAGLAFKIKLVNWLRLTVDASYLMASGEALSSNAFPYMDPPKTDFTMITGLVGAEYVLGLGDSLDFYAGLGVGYLIWTEKWSGEGVEGDYDGSSLGYGVQAGIDYKLSDSFVLSGEIRYLLSEFKVDDSAKAYLGDTTTFAGASLMIGIGYVF